ncbi:MAG: lipopolysaccharide heptosyltransferase II [Sulfuricurvum sp.]|uniref:lipopolysaccharide heptosyltransferase II n=1 Tax=Sulfuricurvum sp. TaxID=2025608 RepID=UPI0026168B68|nr:lipopolysaccharide heptosyltransferase II [Sulfuricurvum sp.]MDD2828621.1 lipopolysaccharide heptosyltransferase II [Sulfuricurvum sp.]MDD4948298.1 lipopolysaccharide heptosyltransferase II [Sulfuricurvum sp.]
MKILIILPNWLGDAVMATPAIEALCKIYPEAELTLVGSFVSIEALKYHPQCKRYIIDETKKGGNRLLNTYNFAKELGAHDIAITFRNQLHSSLLLYWSGTPITAGRKSWHSSLLLTHAITPSHPSHLVEQYRDIAQSLSSALLIIENLKLHIPPHRFSRPTLGINPGATYGSAKRWYPDKFAEVARAYSDRFEIILFGGPNEVGMANDIESRLEGINVTNLAGKTSIVELCSFIGGLDLFITNDSGPMHVAAAYQVPTVAIFGPTRHLETSQWMNEKSIIVRHDMKCAPCMKRECPLGHHECMTSITADEVIKAVNTIALQGHHAE